jgi:hypothetical protein
MDQTDPNVVQAIDRILHVAKKAGIKTGKFESDDHEELRPSHRFVRHDSDQYRRCLAQRVRLNIVQTFERLRRHESHTRHISRARR